MEDEYVFDSKTKQLKTGGNVPECPPGGIGKLIFEKLKSHAEQGFIAQIDATTGYEDSYKDFFKRCRKLSLYLTKIGIKPGDIVVSCSPQNMDDVTIFFSCLFVGAIYASVDSSLNAEEVTKTIKMVESNLIIASEECLELVEKARCGVNNCKLILMQKHNQYDNLQDVFHDNNDKDIETFESIFIQDTTKTLCIVFSSGTTGFPKGICLSHNFYYNYLHEHSTISTKYGLPPQMVVLSSSYLFWTSGIQISLCLFFTGTKRLFCQEIDCKEIWDIVDKYQVHCLNLVYHQAVKALEFLKEPRPNVFLFCIPGSQIPIPKQREYGKMLPNSLFYSSYGITEVGGISLNIDYNNPSCGKPYHNSQIIKVVDINTEQPLDIGCAGEIRVKNNSKMNGFYKRNSDDCYDSDGFFKTGDFGYFNDKYELFVIDRILETFKYSNNFVDPKIIERHLETHDCVHQCVVVGIPNITGNIHAMALVVLRDNSNVSCEELLEFANSKMNHTHQIRAGIKIISKDYIPYTTTGKVKRRLLRDKIVKLMG